MNFSDQLIDFTDQPMTAVLKEDPLYFEQYRELLKGIALEAGTPITIGIFGPWGSGKTSLMRMIERGLNNQRAEDHTSVMTVWFNAWQYNREEALWRALLLRILDVLRNSQTDNQDFHDELDRLEDSLYQTVEWEEIGPWTIDWLQFIKHTFGKATDTAVQFVPGVAPLIKILNEARELFPNDEDEVAAVFQQKVTEYRRHQVHSMEQFRRGFEEVLREHVVSRNQRLIVFIDDLDRCVPDKAIPILEAINLYLDVPGCVFFLGVDRDVIEKGIRVRYQDFLLGPEEQLAEEDLFRRIPITGQDYMEKIVQLPFALPTPRQQQIEQFVKSLLPDELDNCATVFALGLEENPRKIKRGIHVFHMLRRLAKLANIEDLDPALLAKIVIIQSRYRGLYADIIQDANLLPKLEQFARGKIEMPELSVAGQHDLRHQNPRLRLRRMLSIAPYFEPLPLKQLGLYLYLTHTASEAKEPIESQIRVASEEIEQHLLQDLLSDNIDWIQDTVKSIRVAKQEQAYGQLLLKKLESQESLPPTARRSIGTALSLLGDPRDFDAMIQVPCQAFCIGKYPVTNGQFQRFVRAGGYENKDYWDEKGWQWVSVSQVKGPLAWDNPGWDADNRPVAGINWYEANAYCAWLRAHEGKDYRLPTVDEWLMAFQGEDKTKYPWGDELPSNSGYANTTKEGLHTTTAVGLYPLGTNAWGFADMVGNVWEWTGTKGEQPGTRLLKGGSWQDNLEGAHSEVSKAILPTFRDLTTGFRVLSIPFQ